jgi:hypothetical protein
MRISWVALSSIVPLSLCLLAACSSGSGSASPTVDAGSDASSSADTGSGGGHDAASGATDGASEAAAAAMGSGSLTGKYGTDPIAPIVAAYWIGIPDDPNETGGGPFVYLFSGPVTCADISGASGWVTSIASGTQVTELLIGTTTVGTAVPATAHAAPNALEANHAVGGSSVETRATSGSVTLAAYTKDVSVDGTVDVTFPDGSAKGSFHAVWCPTGHEF